MWGQPPSVVRRPEPKSPYTSPVILSEAADSRRESGAQSNDPLGSACSRLRREFLPDQHKARLAFDGKSRFTAAIMQPSSSIAPAKTKWGIVITGLLITGITSLIHGQDATYPPHKASPPRIALQTFLLAESVVQTQWPQTLSLVNAPDNVTLLNPGQCIRVSIYSTGDNSDDLLQKAKVSFRVEFAGHDSVFPLASPVGFKQIKPEGADFVSAVLNAGGVKMPEAMKTTASLGASADHWCAPVDAGDGIATVQAEVESPNGHQSLTPATIQIQSFESGSKKAFKNSEEIGAFLQTYYKQPNPARLLPALQFVLTDQTQHPRDGQLEIMATFLIAAANSDPVAAQDFRARIAVQPPQVRALGLLILRSAGYDISSVLNTLSADDRQKFLGITPLQDPYDLSPTRELFQHLDMLWAVFGATGQFKPVKTVASALGWRADYEEFDKLRKTPNHPSTLTPSIARGVTYTAAGWSMRSFQRTDPLVADYIDYMLASSETPEGVKSELANLSTNPAFKRAGGQ